MIIMLIVKITSIWFDTYSELLVILLFWWLCKLCASVKTLCDTDVCFCDHVGRVSCCCIDERGLVIQRDGVHRLPLHTSTLVIRNCSSVHIKSKSFEELKMLSGITLMNIKNLTLEQHSFSWNESTIFDTYLHNGLIISVEHTTVSNMPPYVFRGRIDDITFEGVHFELINSYAFTSLAGTKTIYFKNCEFLTVESQAFKKFYVEQVFAIQDSHFVNPLPSRTIMDVAVRDEFLINGASFRRIRSSAFRVHGPRKFQMQNCYVRCMEGEAFMVRTRGPVFVEDNVFHTMETGALHGFHVEKRELDLSGHQEFVFENNTIVQMERASLLFNINSFIPKLDWIFMDTKCDCEVLPNWLSDLIVYSHQYPQEKILPNIKINEIMSCKNNHEYTRLKDFSRDNCGPRTQPLQAVVFVSLMAMLILIIGLLFYWIWYKNRSKRWANVEQSFPVHVPEPALMSINVEKSLRSEPPSPCYEEPSTSYRNHQLYGQDAQFKETEMSVIVECREPVIYSNPLKKRSHIYSNRCVELHRDYVNQRYVNRHRLLISDL